MTKRSTEYFGVEIHKALQLEAASIDRSDTSPYSGPNSSSAF